MIRGMLSCVAVLTLSVLVFAAEKKEDRKPEAKPEEARTHRPSNLVFILIETSDFDPAAKEELQRMYDMLRKVDKDNTGKIDDDGLKAARTQIVEDRADDLIQKLDADNDGRISKAEAKGRILEHFEKLDANHDGFIDRSELIHAITAKAKSPAK